MALAILKGNVRHRFWGGLDDKARELACAGWFRGGGRLGGPVDGRRSVVVTRPEGAVYRREADHGRKHGDRDKSRVTLCSRASRTVVLHRYFPLPKGHPEGPLVTDKPANKMWGGRFVASPAEIMEEINASIAFDKALAPQDIRGSKAHAAMLAESGIITKTDAREIIRGLDQVLSEIEAGTFQFSRALEDVHMNVESRLKEIVGPAAGRLHTARSRNDQVATDFRLFVRDAADGIIKALAQLQLVLAQKAEAHAATVMPGFTHLQPAQPITFGHHLLAYVEMLGRDRGRFIDARKRLNECPLGSAALAGTSFPIDRAKTAEMLGFDRPMANSLDGVADRDFALEILAASAITAMHLSRFAEEIVIWMTPQFGFVRLSDRFTTGSSIMPQKRNPDAAELVRAKVGRIAGAFQGLLDGDEGPAAGLFEGHAGRQGDDVRRARRAAGRAACDDRAWSRTSSPSLK